MVSCHSSRGSCRRSSHSETCLYSIWLESVPGSAPLFLMSLHKWLYLTSVIWNWYRWHRKCGHYIEIYTRLSSWLVKWSKFLAWFPAFPNGKIKTHQESRRPERYRFARYNKKKKNRFTAQLFYAEFSCYISVFYITSKFECKKKTKNIYTKCV